MKNNEILHIAFGGAAGSVVARWIEKKGSGTLIEVYDPLSCGPLYGYGTEIGFRYRNNWMKNVCDVLDDQELWSFVRPYIGMPQLYDKLNEFSSCVVWFGQQVDEQILLRAICAMVDTQQLYIADVSNSHPAVGACAVDDLLEVQLQSIPSTMRSYLSSEWRDINRTRSVVRTFVDGRIECHDEWVFDAAITQACSDVFKDAGEIVGIVLGQYPLQVGDTFIAYRLAKLINGGQLSKKGGPQIYRTQIRLNNV